MRVEQGGKRGVLSRRRLDKLNWKWSEGIIERGGKVAAKEVAQRTGWLHHPSRCRSDPPLCVTSLLHLGWIHCVAGGKSTWKLSISVWLLPPQRGGGWGPSGAVGGAEIDGSAACFTLLPIPDNQINLHSSTLMKVPRRHRLFLLVSSLAPTLSSCWG